MSRAAMRQARFPREAFSPGVARNVDGVALAAVRDAPNPGEALRLLWQTADGILGKMRTRGAARGN
ncbi:hypothetical protein GCM10009754_14470 [Amycolatopsis minnesotensis]|uniref:Uncharacterized protein n=1 Tax=Amycolatopsis minnesotensis TaxID=337894 RepID=A0ABN2Q9T3_9PSEU